MDYTTYVHRDVTRLSPADGRALLREVGVTGAGEDVDRVVADWDGHALTLSLLGGYLADRHGGDVARIDEIPPPMAEEPRYERVHRVLRRYDEHLGEAERAFLTLFSAFRTPVHGSALGKVFRQTSKVSETFEVFGPIAALDDAAFEALVRRLVAYRLVRNHYLALLTAGERASQQDAHTRIKDYYLEMAGDTPTYPTLDDLAPLIEVVHHACRAGAYDEAYRIHMDRVDQRRFVIGHQLGAYETDLALMFEFFPGGDTSGENEPQVSKPSAKSWILNEVGLCLMSLGRLGEAAPFYERYVARNIDAEDWHNASIGYRNLAGLHAYLGALEWSAEAAREALALARRAENKRDERDSLAYRAWAAHLRGDLDTASAAFQQAEALERETVPGRQYLSRIGGIRHADHLQRAGQAGYARRVTEANLEYCERNRWLFLVSMCHRVLGDLDADPSTGSGQAGHRSARAHYDEALRIARAITYRPALIEALLARGRWAARCAFQTSGVSQTPEVSVSVSASAAFNDLNEALGYAVDGGYRRYEADVRVALAWAHLAAGDAARAREEAERAHQMSAGMGYHWGQVDAAEVLAAAN